ncbi:hypothetical protein L280_00695 [Mannheimia haemolytica MhBrain2012]|nr:hypothetical protein L280_00695 [Mannheimia haemolytica MhBrain2012]EPZ29808.1 hypothetical protein L281_08115 [Mannheimia haemolytica MhSwine2000]
MKSRGKIVSLFNQFIYCTYFRKKKSRKEILGKLIVQKNIEKTACVEMALSSVLS